MWSWWCANGWQARLLLPAGFRPPPAGRTAARRRPMSHLRQVIAERMARSARTAAPVTLTTEVDASELVRLRETLKAASTDDPAQV